MDNEKEFASQNSEEQEEAAAAQTVSEEAAVEETAADDAPAETDASSADGTETVSFEGSEAIPVEDIEDDETQEKPRTAKERIAYSLYDLASIVGTAVIAIMVVFTFFFRFVGVVGPSMQPTLFENDWLAVAAIPKEPKAGDIVIITQPNAFDEPIVKRVVATGGQTVDIREGHVYIDGVQKQETYISPDIETFPEDLDNYPLTVPEGKVFVLGDNRQHSTDSRSSAIGLIDNDYVLGTVSFRIMPFGKWKVNIEYDY